MIAIVIPYYKKHFFEATLQSLANQTDKRFHVYIGDDASPENPNHLLEKYKEDFACIYKRFDYNLGAISLTQQWERCLDMVKDDEWVVVLGDDDTFGNNFIAEFYTHLEDISRLGIHVVRYATVVINEYGKEISKVYKHPKLETSTDFLMRKLLGGTRSSLSEFVFKKDTLHEVTFKNLPLAWHSDYLAVLECSNFNTIYTINEALVSFRLSGFNITSKRDDLALKNIAAFHFYYYLLDKKSGFFNEKQKERLYIMLEKTFLDNKKNIKFWFLFTKLYFMNLQIKRYLNFIIEVLNSLHKKHKE